MQNDECGIPYASRSFRILHSTFMTCRRLIEVDLPIRTISAHARREKSIRHGHISTLHIWWARRSRASGCAPVSFWPNPWK